MIDFTTQMITTNTEQFIFLICSDNMMFKQAKLFSWKDNIKVKKYQAFLLFSLKK